MNWWLPKHKNSLQAKAISISYQVNWPKDKILTYFKLQITSVLKLKKIYHIVFSLVLLLSFLNLLSQFETRNKQNVNFFGLIMNKLEIEISKIHISNILAKSWFSRKKTRLL